MRKQPEFGQMWADYFGTVPRKITYEVRDDNNGPHDFVFLSSLLHDARIVPERVRLRGKQLTIPLERDCWEVYLGDKLYYTQAVLSVSPVQSVEWRFVHPVFRKPEEALSVSFLEIANAEVPPWTLKIDCTSWKCLIGIDSYSSTIVLRDKTSPISHSRRV
jgi:hypothetical protein